VKNGVERLALLEQLHPFSGTVTSLDRNRRGQKKTETWQVCQVISSNIVFLWQLQQLPELLLRTVAADARGSAVANRDCCCKRLQQTLGGLLL